MATSDDRAAVLDALAEACRAHPHERVGQVFINAIPEPFYTNDVRAAERLRAYAAEETR